MPFYALKEILIGLDNYRTLKITPNKLPLDLYRDAYFQDTGDIYTQHPTIKHMSHEEQIAYIKQHANKYRPDGFDCLVREGFLTEEEVIEAEAETSVESPSKRRGGKSAADDASNDAAI